MSLRRRLKLDKKLFVVLHNDMVYEEHAIVAGIFLNKEKAKQLLDELDKQGHLVRIERHVIND